MTSRERTNMKIIIDNREMSSKITKELTKLGADIDLEQLEVGDYIISDKICIERKTSSDFVGSVFNGRIFKQLDGMKKNFPKSVLIIEGKNIFTERDAHPNSLRGALSSIAIDYSIPILWTDSAKETAALIYWMAKREQEERKTTLSLRGERSGRTMPEKQEYLIAGLPGINTKRSKALLERFGTPEGIFHASEEELLEVEGIGKKTVETMKELLRTSYKDI